MVYRDPVTGAYIDSDMHMEYQMMMEQELMEQNHQRQMENQMMEQMLMEQYRQNQIASQRAIQMANMVQGSPVGGRRLTKRDIMGYLSHIFQTGDIVEVDVFEAEAARHICPNGAEIHLLRKQVSVLHIPEAGSIQLEYCFCPKCRRLVVNRGSLEVV